MLVAITLLSIETAQLETPGTVILDPSISEETLEFYHGMNLSVAGFLAILCGLLAACLMTTRQFCVRKYKGTYPPLQLAIDSAILQNLIFCIPSILLAVQDNTFQKDGVYF